MKSCSSTSIILNLLALSATTRAVGNFQIDYASCGATGTAFIQKEYALVLQSAVYMNTNLNAPSQTTNTLVGYMFGTAQRGYDPISFPQVVFGGGGTNNILGLANFATAQTPAGLGDGDFVSCSLAVLIIVPTWSDGLCCGSGPGATSGRMHELVLMIYEKIFCNIDHFIPPDVFDGETDWYDPCKQNLSLLIASPPSQPVRLTFFFRLRDLHV